MQRNENKKVFDFVAAKKNTGFFENLPTQLLNAHIILPYLFSWDLLNFRKAARFFYYHAALVKSNATLNPRKVELREFIDLIAKDICPMDLTVRLTTAQISYRVVDLADALRSGKCKQGLTLDFSGQNLSSLQDTEISALMQALSKFTCPPYLRLNFCGASLSSKLVQGICALIESDHCPKNLVINFKKLVACQGMKPILIKAMGLALLNATETQNLSINLSNNLIFLSPYSGLLNSVFSTRIKNLTVDLSGNFFNPHYDSDYNDRLLISKMPTTLPANLQLDLRDSGANEQFLTYFWNYLRSLPTWNNLAINLADNKIAVESLQEFTQWFADESNKQAMQRQDEWKKQSLQRTRPKRHGFFNRHEHAKSTPDKIAHSGVTKQPSEKHGKCHIL